MQAAPRTYAPRSTANSRHSPGMPFSSCAPRSVNLMPDPATRSLTVFETSTSSAAACAATRAPVWTTMPATLPSAISHSPVWEPGADGQAKLAHSVDDRTGAADSPRRPVERGEEAVARGVDLAPAEPQQLPAHQVVVALQQVAPVPVADLDRLGRRFDDVGKQDGSEHPVGLHVLPAAGLPDVGQESLDVVLHARVGPQTHVPDAGHLHEPRRPDALRG